MSFWPPFLNRLFSDKPSAASAGRALATLRHNRERNRIIDRANEMAAALGKPSIPRRPEA
jgi:hypothetical protein